MTAGGRARRSFPTRCGCSFLAPRFLLEIQMPTVMGNCCFILAPTAAAKSSPAVCVACGRKLPAVDERTWAVYILKGVLHRVCPVHVEARFPLLDAACRKLNGDRPRNPMWRTDDPAAGTFTMIRDDFPDDPVRDPEPVELEDAPTTIYEDDPRARELLPHPTEPGIAVRYGRL